MASIPTIEVVVTGDELTTGRITDTNSQFLLGRLQMLGATARRITTVGDVVEDIRAALTGAAERADVVVMSGGLGPTTDDLTVDVVSALCGVEPVVDPIALDRIHKVFRRFGRELPAGAERQARVPRGADVLGNPAGLAPAFAVRLARATVYCLPGVPREYRAIVEQEILPRVFPHGPARPTAARILRCAGTPESVADAAMRGFEEGFPDVRVSFRVPGPEVWVTLVAHGDTQEAAVARLAAAETEARRRLGESVYGADEETLAARVGALLRAGGLSLGVAESCTGGLIAAAVTEVAGSSEYFMGGVNAYANRVKTELLGVPDAVLAAHGAVSAPVAEALATGAQARLGAKVGVSTTGIAGPGGGTAEKPVGLVYLGLAGPWGVLSKELRLVGDRERIRSISASAALDWLRRALERGRA